MATVVPEQINEKVIPADDTEYGQENNEPNSSAFLPLGKPQKEKKFWFQRTSNDYDPHEIATQVYSGRLGSPELLD
jgi:hypothetical protein